VALQQVVGESASAVVDWISKHFNDQGQLLVQALRTAGDRTWKAIEIALAGDSWWSQIKAAVFGAEQQAFAQQVRAFLNAAPLPELANRGQVRERCLFELRQARKEGLLDAGGLTPVEVAGQAKGLVGADPAAVLKDQGAAIQTIVERLRTSGKPNLSWFAALPYNGGPPLLAVAVRHFFRLEVGRNAKLSQMLTFSQLDSLTEEQKRGLQQLHEALTLNGQALEDLGATVEKLAVLGQDTNQRVRELQEQVAKLIERLHMANREVRPRDSMSIRSESERALVRKLLEAHRGLPEDWQKRHPELLGDLGKLLVATGDFRQALDEFKKAAALARDDAARAEAHYNGYRAALEKKEWAGALEQLIGAVKGDARRFAPFPMGKYGPERILGAGGFGVVFLCRHKHMDMPVVVKALLLDDLDREVDNVFSEAKVLGQLNGPAFVRMYDCGYVDPVNKSRPYLVMDYFDGLPLDEHVKRHGCLSLADLKAIMMPIAQALQAAHDKDILHRDVKPANILVRKDSEGRSARLIDFGLAVKQSSLENTVRNFGPADQTLASGSIAGTLDYAAPEQLGKLPGVSVSPRSDIYGFGKTCYYALLQTPDPDEHQKKALPQGWKKFLANCTAQPGNRLPDFGAVFQKLKGLKAPAVAQGAGSGSVKSLTGTTAGGPSGAPAAPQKPAAAPPSSPVATRQLACPHCHRPLAVPTGVSGGPFRCPRCAETFSVPDPGEPGGASGMKTDEEIVFFSANFKKSGSGGIDLTPGNEGAPKAPSTPPVQPKAPLPARPVAPTSPIVVACPHCRGRVAVAREHAGRVVQCPQCRGQFTVPPPPLPWKE
jgi:serine/threonine protein kinase